MNGSSPSRNGDKDANKEADRLCDRIRLCELNERPRLSFECHERARSLLHNTKVSDPMFVDCIHERASEDPLQKMHHDIQQPSDHDIKPGARFSIAHDFLADKVAAFRKPEPDSRIEVFPGMMARLRGAKETLRCVENDFYLPTSCICCSQDLFCIMDASFVLCPRCRVINPMEGSADGLEGGVGIGFTLDDLREFQTEILLRQHAQGKFG